MSNRKGMSTCTVPLMVTSTVPPKKITGTVRNELSSNSSSSLPPKPSVHHGDTELQNTGIDKNTDEAYYDPRVSETYKDGDFLATGGEKATAAATVAATAAAAAAAGSQHQR